ncbi:MAG: hypothetical protein AB7K41_09880 [Bdellovibrionales bacterium]
MDLTAYDYAVALNLNEMLQVFIDEGVDLNQYPSLLYGNNPLHFFVLYLNGKNDLNEAFKTLETLLNVGIKIDSKNKRGETALSLFIEYDEAADVRDRVSLPVFRKFLELNADISVPLGEGQDVYLLYRALHPFSEPKNDYAYAEELLKHPHIQRILNKKQYMNGGFNKGDTALLLAIKRAKNNNKVAERLIKKMISLGADINDPMGCRTPLITSYQSPQIAELLIDSGADPNHAAESGSGYGYCAPPLHMVSQVYSERDYPSDVPAALEYVKVLLNRGADVNLRVHGRTPLGMLNRSPYASQLIKLLQDAGGTE